jgi:hypothetical protein
MSSQEHFLLVFQGNDGKKIVLEFESEHYLNGKLAAAKELGVWVRRLSAEKLKAEEFKDAQFYDMRHHATTKIFHLEQWQNYLVSEKKQSSLSE